MEIAELRSELARLGLPTIGDAETLRSRLDDANSNKLRTDPSSHPDLITCPVHKVRARMKNMFQEALFSDVTVVVMSSSAGECSVILDLHRNVLANHSDFFRDMFTRSFRESAEETVTIEVAEGSSVAATVLVLEYIYTSTARIDSNIVTEVFASADKLQLPDLRDYCEAYLAQNLCRHSVCSIWKVSHLLDLTQLGTKCKDLVLSQGELYWKKAILVT